MHLPLTVSLLLGLNGQLGYFNFNQTSLNQLNQFGFGLLKDLHSDANQTDAKTAGPIFSVFGLANALAMCAIGASGSTKQLFEYKLPILTDFENTIVDENRLTELAHPVPVQTLNKIVITDPKINFLPEYAHKVKQIFKADIRVKAKTEKMEDLAKELNDWASEVTKGRIQKLTSDLPEYPPVHLLNGLSFDAFWEKHFDNEKTKVNNFYDENGKTYSALFMNDYNQFLFRSFEDYSLLKLPYEIEEGRASLLVILPNANIKIDQILANLNVEQLNQQVRSLRYAMVNVSLPKFSFEANLDLGSILKKLGFEFIFTTEANFKKMSNTDLMVSSITQSIQITVDEDGTRAFAGTRISMVPRGIGGHSFIANRPFVYILDYGGANLFTGVYQKPPATE